MEQKELIEQVNKMLSDNPAKIIKVRDTFDEIFEGRNINSSQVISDRDYEKIRDRFRDVDIPFSWCTDKATIYQLYKTINQRRTRESGSVYAPNKKSSKSKKKGLFSFLN